MPLHTTASLFFLLFYSVGIPFFFVFSTLQLFIWLRVSFFFFFFFWCKFPTKHNTSVTYRCDRVFFFLGGNQSLCSAVRCVFRTVWLSLTISLFLLGPIAFFSILSLYSSQWRINNNTTRRILDSPARAQCCTWVNWIVDYASTLLSLSLSYALSWLRVYVFVTCPTRIISSFSFSRYSFSVVLRRKGEVESWVAASYQWEFVVVFYFFIFYFFQNRKWKARVREWSEWAHTRRRRHASPLDLRVGELRRKKEKETRLDPSSLGTTSLISRQRKKKAQ